MAGLRERRRGCRIVWRRAPDDSSTIILVDLGAGGCRVRTDRPDPPGSIWIAGRRVAIEVLHEHPLAGGGRELGARFTGLGAEDQRALAQLINEELQATAADVTRLVDPRQAVPVSSPLLIRNLLGAVEPPRLLSVADGALRLPVRLRLAGVAFRGGQRVLRTWREGDSIRLGTEETYTFMLHGPACVTVFESRCVEETGLEVTLALPAEVRQAGHRGSRRAALARDLVRVSYAQPGRERRAGGPVLDAGAGGLSFRPHEAALTPGQRLADLKLELPGETLEGQAVVCHVARRERGGQGAVGVRLELSAAGERAWRRFVFGQAHPEVGVAVGGAEEDWVLLEASRYVELWTSEGARAHLRRRHLAAWRAPDPGAGVRLQVRREGRARGTVAATLVYPRTWMLHHLARDPLAGHQAQAPLRDACGLIIALIDHLTGQTDLESFVMYLERDKRWNERLYFDFARHYFDPDRLALSALHVHRRSTSPVEPGGDEPPVVVASGPLLAQLAAALARTTPAVVRQALALDEARIDLGAFPDWCARRGHERQRRIFCAAGAALVADSGDEGVNIFGLLNTCRLHSLTGAPPSAVARRALLRQAIAHYRSLGKREFLLLADDNGDGEPTRLGFQSVSAGLCWIGHRDVLPAWSAYLEALIAPTRPASPDEARTA